jgi:hypothetical protein
VSISWIILENDQEEKIIKWNSSDRCSELDSKGFKEHSGQGIPSISKLVGEGIARWMIPTPTLATTYESENFGMKFNLRGRDCNIPGLEVTN